MSISKFSSSELRHYAKRADLYALDETKEKLRDIAWKISNNKEIKKDKAEVVLKRIAEIPNLDKTCINQDCEKCEKITDEFEVEHIPSAWNLNVELYRWQKEAKKAWKNNGGKGILKVVTGAGKTIFALSMMKQIHDRYQGEDIKFVIIVPGTALLDQWLEEVIDMLNVAEDDIGLYYGEKKDDIKDKEVMIYVINSARDVLKEDIEKTNDDVFLTVDECHKAGSEANSRIFQANFDYTLGISATPERKSDYGFEKILTKNLGKLIYEYSYSEARNDGVIPPYRLKRIAVPLTEREEQSYERFSKKLKKIAGIISSKYPELKDVSDDEFFKKLGELQNKYDDKYLEKFTVLTNQRKSIIHESDSKIRTLKYLIRHRIDPKARIIIFHERTEIADQIYDYLLDNDISCTIYHSKIDAQTRKDNLAKYKDGEKNILVTCRALDEGIDVPDTSIGIIVAATSSVRQRVQRMGRILRKSPGKDYSEIYTIYIRDKEESIFDKEDIIELEKSADKIEKVELDFN